jgi:thymidylate synthase
MPNLIQSQNCLSAWKDACSYILNNGDGFNLVVHIISPNIIDDNHLNEILNSNIISKKALSDVSNTIFPYNLYQRNQNQDISHFYDLHEKLYVRGKTLHKKNKSRWGNYFLRFTKFGINKENQIQKIINDINSRPNKQSACYIMHVSSIDYDSNTRIIGNPCLQYLQFAQVGNTLNLTAIYRNHDFLTKALGNYIGLTRLLGFVCGKTNAQIGTITCHSIHYYLNNKKNVKNCIDNLSW